MEKYAKAQMEVIEFEAEDVITTSSILLCCSPLLALAWCYVMYQISYRIFVKQEL